MTKQYITKRKQLALPMELVYIEWYDAYGGSIVGWKDISKIKLLKPMLSKAVGFYIKEDNISGINYIIICPYLIGTEEDDPQGDGEIAIPKSWIKEFKVVSFKRKRNKT